VATRALLLQILLIAGAAVTLLVALALATREPKVTYDDRWFCFDKGNNPYRVGMWRAFGRLELRASGEYSVAPWQDVPAYLNVPNNDEWRKGVTRVTVLDGWPWPCLARHQISAANGTIPASYERAFKLGQWQLPMLPRWPALIGDTLFYAGAFGTMYLVFAGVRSLTGRLRGRCLSCGYDLRGLPPATACPECGRAR
jgi:hypothetical protein